MFDSLLLIASGMLRSIGGGWLLLWLTYSGVFQGFIYFILQALSQQEYIMTNNNHYMCDITNVTGNHNSFRPITVIPKRKRTSTVLHKHTHTDRQT